VCCVVTRWHENRGARAGFSLARRGSSGFGQAQRPMSIALPPNWRAIIDPESGEPYFVNSVTGETTWDDPRLQSVAAASSDVQAKQGKLLLDSLGSVDRSLRHMSSSAARSGRLGDGDQDDGDQDDDEDDDDYGEEVEPSPRAPGRPRRTSTSLLVDANRREVCAIAPDRTCLDHRLVVPSDLPAGYVDVNLYRKSKDEWVLLSYFSVQQVARVQRTATRSLTKGASYSVFVGLQTTPSAVCVQSARSLHPVFHLAEREGGDALYTLARKRGANELRVYTGKSENADDIVFTVLFGEDRCLFKAVDLQALGFHLMGTVSDIHLGKFTRIASGGDALLILLSYVLVETVTGKAFAMKWEGDIVAQYERNLAKGVSDVAKLLRE